MRQKEARQTGRGPWAEEEVESGTYLGGVPRLLSWDEQGKKDMQEDLAFKNVRILLRQAVYRLPITRQ